VSAITDPVGCETALHVAVFLSSYYNSWKQQIYSLWWHSWTVLWSHEHF